MSPMLARSNHLDAAESRSDKEQHQSDQGAANREYFKNGVFTNQPLADGVHG